MGRQITLFGDKSLNREKDDRIKRMRSEIQEEDAETVLNTSKSDYVDYILNKYQFEPVEIGLADTELDVDDYKLDANLTIIVPVAGNIDLLRFQPQRSREPSIRATVKPVDEGADNYELHIEKRPKSRGWDPDRVKNEHANVKDQIKTDWMNLQDDVEEYNSEIKEKAQKLFENRYNEAKEQREMFADLDIPLRRRESTPNTVSIDGPERREPIEKPDVEAENAEQPALTITDSTYEAILEAINDIGIGFERSPELFSEYGEEDLRDFIRVFLEMNFDDGTATGETFNKEGKTDILVRAEDSTNVFVAECGVWDGKKHFKEKVDQLFSYLTWRDSKAAVIMFVDRKNMETIRDRLAEGAEEHQDINRLDEKKDESWWQYRAHLPNQKDSKVDLAVFAFHIPS